MAQPTTVGSTNIGAFCGMVAGGVLLLVRRNYGDRNWTLPGGAVEPGEELIAGLTREVEEETGYRLRAPRHVCTFYSRQHYSVAFCFLEAVPATIAQPPPTPEIAERAWFALDRLPAEMSARQKNWVSAVAEFLRTNSSLGARESDV